MRNEIWWKVSLCKMAGMWMLNDKSPLNASSQTQRDVVTTMFGPVHNYSGSKLLSGKLFRGQMQMTTKHANERHMFLLLYPVVRCIRDAHDSQQVYVSAERLPVKCLNPSVWVCVQNPPEPKYTFGPRERQREKTHSPSLHKRMASRFFPKSLKLSSESAPENEAIRHTDK